jgi:hypothetical protein
MTGSHGIEACHGCVAESNPHISATSAVRISRCTDLLRSTPAVPQEAGPFQFTSREIGDEWQRASEETRKQVWANSVGNK